MSREMPRKLDAAAIWCWLLAGYWLALCVATHLPPAIAGLPGHHTDKLVHVLAYRWARLPLGHGVGPLDRVRSTGGTCSLPGWRSSLYGIADELTQPWFGRTASVGDWLADAIGAAIGLSIFWVCKRFLGRT